MVPCIGLVTAPFEPAVSASGAASAGIVPAAEFGARMIGAPPTASMRISMTLPSSSTKNFWALGPSFEGDGRCRLRLQRFGLDLALQEQLGHRRVERISEIVLLFHVLEAELVHLLVDVRAVSGASRSPGRR